MIDDRWMPPASTAWPTLSAPSLRRDRNGLTERERLLAVEITQDHHAELHRQTVRRLEAGDNRMDHIEDRISRIRDAQAREAQTREDRAAVKVEFREARNRAVQMAVWIASLLMCGIAVWNFATARSGSAPPPAITAPAPR